MTEARSQYVSDLDAKGHAIIYKYLVEVEARAALEAVGFDELVEALDEVCRLAAQAVAGISENNEAVGMLDAIYMTAKAALLSKLKGETNE